MDIQKLKEMPIWQMTGEEFIFLQKNSPQNAVQQSEPSNMCKKYVYGISGIAKLFGCSIPTASRIKKSKLIDEAITQIGRKIIVDAELALELAGRNLKK